MCTSSVPQLELLHQHAQLFAELGQGGAGTGYSLGGARRLLRALGDLNDIAVDLLGDRLLFLRGACDLRLMSQMRATVGTIRSRAAAGLDFGQEALLGESAVVLYDPDGHFGEGLGLVLTLADQLCAALREGEGLYPYEPESAAATSKASRARMERLRSASIGGNICE